MSPKQESSPNYKAVNWQNHNRRLTLDEYQEIESRVAGLHFSKEGFINDPIAMQGLYAAEALLRELRILSLEMPFPDTEYGA